MNHTVSCFTFTNNKRVLFSVSAKGWVICVDASTRALFFGIFCFCVCVRIFLFSYKKWRSSYVFMELSKNDANLLSREARADPGFFY
jgi:hypothetical protein